MSISQPSAAAAAGLKRAPSLVGQVADGLGRQIRDGTFAPGAMLPSVQALAENWGVSRTVMREALARLSADGLVTSRQGLGVFVANALPAERLALTPGADTADVVRILELRLGLESEAAGFAALRRQPRHLAAMRKALVQMERCVDAADFDKSVAADLDFHRAVCAATGNDHFDALFVFLSQFLHTNIAISRRNSATLRGRGMEAQIEHRAIYEAIEAGNANTARRAARQHVLNTARRLGMEMAAEGE